MNIKDEKDDLMGDNHWSVRLEAAQQINIEHLSQMMRDEDFALTLSFIGLSSFPDDGR